MVRTRKMGNVGQVLPSAGSSSYDIRNRRSARNAENDEEEDDSDDSDYIVGARKKRPKATCSIPKEAESPESQSSGEVILGANRQLAKNKHHIEDNDDLDVAERSTSIVTESNARDGIRRSTRQRKFVYDTLNQRWLLGSARLRDFSVVDDVVSKRVEKGKKVNKVDIGEDGDSGAAYEEEDMYSRIKRERRKSVRSYYNYGGKSQKAGNNSDQSCESVEYESVDEDLDDSREGSSEEETHDDDVRNTKYYLRQKKPIIDRFQVPIEPRRLRNTSKSIFHTPPSRALIRSGRNFHASFRSPGLKSPLMKRRRRHATHNSSTSSSSSSCEDERRFERRKAKSMARARNRCLPMNLVDEDLTNCNVLRGRLKIGSSLADVDPMTVDRSVTFDSIGGLVKHIQALKEMLLLPLMYPEVFEKFKIVPPRGVLFYGPPGTGKTLVARALANECSQGERKVAFFMRKGADCLSKWVGESERQLRLLFDQAFSMRPSIIFFDEIDGLAPVRSTRQDQIHSSIVSTLLALMDGLDSRGEVVVIGATNRIDAIDPALRRPGRFDREFNFSLPSLEARHTIISIHTKEWNPPLSEDLIEELAEKTVGYCGADIKALCAEAAFLALRRLFPEIYQSRQKLQLDVSTVKIEAQDFYKALSQIVPAGQRSSAAPGRPLSSVVRPLLQNMLNRVLGALKVTFPQGFTKSSKNQFGDGQVTSSNVDPDTWHSSDEGSNAGDELLPEFTHCQSSKQIPNNIHRRDYRCRRNGFMHLPSHRPRLLLVGQHGQGQSTHVAPAVLHYLEKFPVHKLDLPALFAVTAKSPEESCSQIFTEAQRVLPGILYLPHVCQWYDTLSETVKATFLTLLNDMDPSLPLLLLATSDCPFEELPEQVQMLFNPVHGEVVTMINPGQEERRTFFSGVILYETKRLPKRKRKVQKKNTATLPVAPQPQPRALSEAELLRLEQHEEATLRELRMFLREILYKLARDRRFVIFTKPVDTAEVSDYLEVIQHPMDLETMMTKIDLHKYLTVNDFLSDIDLICSNALDYNPDRDPSDKIIRHRACALKDAAHALVVSELDPEFEEICQEIKEARMQRGHSPSKYAPKHYVTAPRPVEPKVHETRQHMLTAGDERVLSPRHTFESAMERSNNITVPDLKRSRRLRGLSVNNKDCSDPDNRCVGAREPRHLNNHHMTPTHQRTFRRRRSLWFGARRRRIITKHAKMESLSDDSQEAISFRDSQRTSIDNPINVMNGDVHSVKDQLIGDLRLKLSECGSATDATHVKCNGEIRTCRSTRTSADDALSANKVPLDHLDLLDAENNLLGESEVIHKDTCAEDQKKVSKDMEEMTLKDEEDNGINVMQISSSAENDVSLVANSSPSNSLIDVTAVEAEALNELEFKKTDKDQTLYSLHPKGNVDFENCTDVEASDTTPCKVTIDEDMLRNLLEKIIMKTSGCSVDCLERLHCRLHQCICVHRQNWDRTLLIQDLEVEVERFSRRNAR